ncbi:MAG: LuxR C-terminal-related transcriptional regulator, partial [Solirubrobacteraceae bacterium]
AAGKQPRVIILTTFDADEHVYEALRAGASGFMVKDMPSGEIVAGIRAVARGDALLAPSVTRRLIGVFAAEAGPVDDPDIDQLTERELEVLRLVARGLSNAEIAGVLKISEKTVKTHVGSMLRTLGLRDRVQAVVLAYEVGLARPAGR